jgi:hypothetical protein
MAMQAFTQKIVEMMKSEKLFASQGGPIILSQASLNCQSHYETNFDKEQHAVRLIFSHVKK